MANPQSTTADESPLSPTKSEIIKEAKRIEESLLLSSKGHFAAAHVWKFFHLIVGLPVVILSAILSGSAFKKIDTTDLYAGIFSITVVALSSLMTFLNPNEKSSVHLNAGNNLDSLMNKTRIFRSIDCWQSNSEEVLNKKLKDFSDQKDKLNQSSPQIPFWAYLIAKWGIKSGQGDFTVDKK